MEKNPQYQKEKKQSKQTGKKKYGFLHFLRALAYMLRRRSPKRVAIASRNALLKELVGSVRPLHLQHSSPLHIGISVDENQENQIFSSSPPRSETSDEDTSRYASAQNLKDLDIGDANDEDEGDGEVDRKAEEFIANFYKQMRMQRQDSIYQYQDIV